MTSDFLFLLEQDEGRYARDPEVVGGDGGICIHTQEPGLASQPLGRRRELRPHHSAWSAPRRPDVEQDRPTGESQMTRQRIVVDINRFCERQIVPAFAAFCESWVTAGRDAIGGAA